MTLILLVNSDLSLKIDENNLSAHPMTDDGFAMMWAGVRANYGITKGQVGYEVKVNIMELLCRK
jgi:hypothetical protein